MTTRLELTEEVLEAIGRPDDAAAKAYAVRGINAGIITVGLLFEPPELRTDGTLTALTTQNHVDMSTLTRLLRVDVVWNSTGSIHVWPLPFRLLQVLNLPSSGNVEYYSQFGNTMYYKPIPTVAETLNVFYVQQPARLTDDTDLYPFEMHEDVVLAIGIEIAFGFLEEDGMVGAWQKITDRLGVPQTAAVQIRKALREEIDIEQLQRVSK